MLKSDVVQWSKPLFLSLTHRIDMPRSSRMCYELRALITARRDDIREQQFTIKFHRKILTNKTLKSILLSMKISHGIPVDRTLQLFHRGWFVLMPQDVENTNISIDTLTVNLNITDFVLTTKK